MACGIVDACHYLNQCWNIFNWTLRNKPVKSSSKFIHSHSRKCISKHRLEMVAIFLGLKVLKHAQLITTKSCIRHDRYVARIFYKEEHHIASLNFAFDRNIVAGTGARPILSKSSLFGLSWTATSWPYSRRAPPGQSMGHTIRSLIFRTQYISKHRVDSFQIKFIWIVLGQRCAGF